MCPLEYHRPETIDEALTLLARGIPLAGGTQIAPARRELTAVIDLQDLGLNQSTIEDDMAELGAMVTLQQLLDLESLPTALRAAARREAGWNIRNVATLGGLLHAADGRSPLLTTLVACRAQVRVMPGDRLLSLDAYLDSCDEDVVQLLTEMDLQIPTQLRFSDVARSPSDRPIVSVAAAWYERDAEMVYLGLGGAGMRPVRVSAQTLAEVSEKAVGVYAGSDDPWASAAYRAAAGRALARRLFEEVVP